VKLPKLEKAFVDTQKITDYLLSEENSGGKSAFFLAFGFSRAQPEEVRNALLALAAAYKVASFTKTPHGIKYVIDGEMRTPDGRTCQVRTVWIVDTGEEAPRLVTAYPL
jgi:hypothetical protein